MSDAQYAALFDLVIGAERAQPSLQLHGESPARALRDWAARRGIDVIEYELTLPDVAWSAIRVPGDAIVVHLDDDVAVH